MTLKLAALANDAAFRALADRTRREILRMLRNGPRTSGEIAAEFDTSWPTISRHLAILRESRLVLATRSGQEIHYELNTSVFQDLIQHLVGWMTPVPKPARRQAPAKRRIQEA